LLLPSVDQGMPRVARKATSNPPAPGAVRLASPPLIAPALATPAAIVPAGDRWLYEVKFDGYRMMASIDAGKVDIRSRNGIAWSGKLPELADELAAFPARQALLDGEIVHLNEKGISEFEGLKADLSDRNTARLVYMVFDLLVLDGWDLRPCRQEDRKSTLASLLAGPPFPRIRYSDHHVGGAQAFQEAACKYGLEGLVFKRRDAAYRSGRTDNWRKVKCGARQELVVVGFTDPERSRRGFGALLLGYNEPGKRLVYAGRVGTGFDDRFLVAFRRQLDAIEQATATVKLPKGRSPKGAHWVKPQFVAEIRFTEWTKDGLLRHPSFLGLREDKGASDVVRETAAQGLQHTSLGKEDRGR
jgi:bifunctional non-homologous end joining protein LigD